MSRRTTSWWSIAPGAMDELTVLCEPAPPRPLPPSAAHPARAARSHRPLDGVQLLPPGGVPRSEGKAVRVVDERSR